MLTWIRQTAKIQQQNEISHPLYEVLDYGSIVISADTLSPLAIRECMNIVLSSDSLTVCQRSSSFIEVHYNNGASEAEAASESNQSSEDETEQESSFASVQTLRDRGRWWKRSQPANGRKIWGENAKRR